MKFLLLNLFSFIGFFPTSAPEDVGKSPKVHDFHLSKCLIEYNMTDKAIQISMQIFIDDLEEALRKEGADNLALCTEKEAPDAEVHFKRYLTKHFRLSLNGKEATYNYLGKEISDDLQSLWCYLEIEQVTNLREIKVSNDILMEIFDDQQNIINVKGPGNQGGMWLFKKGKSSDVVSF